MKPILALLVASVLCSGCAHKYNLNSVSRAGVLRTNATALVALPEDGHFEEITYPGSGRKAALAVSAAFARHLQRVDIMPVTATLDVQLAKARAAKSDYLIVPTVVHWEDRATEWSGRSDRIEIEVRTLDAPSGDTLALGSVKGKSKWATFGGDVPEDLLAAPLNAYVGWLFSPEDTPAPLPRGKPRRQDAKSAR